MITIYLVRHGQTLENANGVFQGQTPGTLSALGKEQAETLCDTLVQMHFDTVYCSDLQRCKDTAAIALKLTSYQPIYTPLLRERDMGNRAGSIAVSRVGAENSMPTAEELLKIKKS